MFQQTNRKKTITLNSGTISIQDDETGKLICMIVRGAFREWSNFVIDDISQHITVSNLRTNCGKGLQSGVIGYMDTWTPYQKKQIKKHALVKPPIRPTVFMTQHPQLFKELGKLIKSVDVLYKEYVPDIRSIQYDALRGNKFKLFGSGFTTATVNVNAELGQHTDSHNLKGSYSVMTTFTRQLKGGMLRFPTYDLNIHVGDGDLFIMDGSIPHLTTPIQSGDRVSIVLYARHGIVERKNELKNWTVDSLNKFYAKL